MDTHLEEQLKAIEENSSRYLKKREQWTPLTNTIQMPHGWISKYKYTHGIHYSTDTMVGVPNTKNGL